MITEYHKVAGAPASVDIQGLLSLRPLVRRKKREAPAGGEEQPRRRPALAAGSTSGGETATGAQGDVPRVSSVSMPKPESRAESSTSIKVDDISLTDAAKCLLMMTTCPAPKASLVTVGSAKRQWI